MHYEETEIANDLAPFVRAVWYLRASGSPKERFAYDALPDGCVELIHRLVGTSSWQGVQPQIFVAGICSRPAQLTLSGDAEFVGIRLWPWAWNLLHDSQATSFHDRWVEIDRNAGAAALIREPSQITQKLNQFFRTQSVDPIGQVVPTARSTAEVVQNSQRNHRAVQRWFKAQIGLPPRKYFKLLRFQSAIEEKKIYSLTLAQEAAALGYADQAHMARDFREYAGKPTSVIRAKADGPFMDRKA